MECGRDHSVPFLKEIKNLSKFCHIKQSPEVLWLLNLKPSVLLSSLSCALLVCSILSVMLCPHIFKRWCHAFIQNMVLITIFYQDMQKWIISYQLENFFEMLIVITLRCFWEDIELDWIWSYKIIINIIVLHSSFSILFF